MVPGSGWQVAVDFEALEKRQFPSVRRMMAMSLLFHGGMILLGSVVAAIVPVAVSPPVVAVELTDPPYSTLPAEPPPLPAVSVLRVKSGPDAAAPSLARGNEDPESTPAHRWLRQLDAGLAAVSEPQDSRRQGRTAGIPVRRFASESTPRPGDYPPASDPGKNPRAEESLDAREARVRASGRPGVGSGIEAEASVMFGGPGSSSGEAVPPWIRDMIRRKVRGYLPELESVYSAALRRDPGLKGKLLIRFRIDAAGNIQQAESMETSLRDPPFAEAILEKVRRWTFEPTGGRTVDVLYPLVFSVSS